MAQESAPVEAFLTHGDVAALVADLNHLPDLQRVLVEVFTATPESGPAADAAATLLAALGSVEDALLAAGLLARAVEMLIGDHHDLAVESLLTMAEERVSEVAAPSPFVQAQVHFAQAAVRSVRDGEAAFEQPFVQGLLALGPDHPQYPERLRQYALFLAFRGRLNEIAALLPPLETDHDDVDWDLSQPTDYPALRFIDAVESGALDQAQHLAHQLADYPLAPPLDELVAIYDELLVLWQERLSGQPAAQTDPFSEDDLVTSVRALFNRDRRAVFSAIEASTYEEVASASTLFGYQSIRLSLALRDDALAEELLVRRQSLGLDHWLDGVMWARVYLLRGDAAAAGDQFCRALRQASLRGSEDRVDFELRLGMELSPMQLIVLGHRLEHCPVETISVNPLMAGLGSSTVGDRDSDADPAHGKQAHGDEEGHRG